MKHNARPVDTFQSNSSLTVAFISCVLLSACGFH